ncbi:TPA: hypothetical protein ACNEJR_003711 [Escherichia coli]
MIFKWRYAHEVSPNSQEDRLIMGHKCIGRVYPLDNGYWRAESYLPDSCQFGGCYRADLPTAGVARSSLEVASVFWVNNACLWRDPIAPDTMGETSQG